MSEVDIKERLEQTPNAKRWSAGYGAIEHIDETRDRILTLAGRLASRPGVPSSDQIFAILAAADRVASAAMWLVVHETYASRVYLDGRALTAGDFKVSPEGHTGGALNMVPAYAGYMAANAITQLTRSWVMGQGHTVAAIDSVNLLLGNMAPAHAERYSLSDDGLTRYVRDFYSYRLGADGRPDSPLGSHVNEHTAGGMVEGGYLGFTELQYVHMPLPGESLVVFLSDGAFEEQRGSDWAPRWWRYEDSGLVMPIMINNGRRIDQRTTLAQTGGVDWFIEHLDLNSFEPILIDGRDPAAFAWAILEMEQRLAAKGLAAQQDQEAYPVKIPYTVAVAPKGAGFYGEGTNLAHNLPLGSNPHVDPDGAQNFNASARKLWVGLPELQAAVATMRNHTEAGRPLEKDHPLAHRQVQIQEMPQPAYRAIGDLADPSRWSRTSPMAAIDQGFLAVVGANPHLRARVGNPDEMRSNRLQGTLDALKFRVTSPEAGMPESLLGSVITALNEEAVCAAALANKGGINLIATYEAFATKMHGSIRQEITWADSAKRFGKQPGWLSVPLVLTSHTWENAKNERSHQDPSMPELMLGEPSDVSRVLFPTDFNSAARVIAGVFETQGQIWTLVVPKSDSVPELFDGTAAESMLAQGALALDWLSDAEPRIILTAIGAFQLEETIKASLRLKDKGVPVRVVYMLEPARFRRPRSGGEEQHCVSTTSRESLYPSHIRPRIFCSHTRPETMLGVLSPLSTGEATVGLGFVNQGGTLSTPGMMFVNRCSWAHIVSAAAGLLSIEEPALLSAEELSALRGEISPHGVLIP